MPNLEQFSRELGALFAGVAKDIYGKFSKEDKDALAAYAKAMADLALKLAVETDPAKRAVITDNLETYRNAGRLLVAKYELIAANAAEKAAIAALKLALESIGLIILAL
jgi:hypothetical protein